jgi:transcriptional regulator with XRE-family HTH domain
LSTISENMKRLRAAAGMTQQSLAIAAALSVSVVSQIEQGTNSDPRMTTLVALARALGVTVDALISGEAPTTGQAVDEAAEEKLVPRKRQGKRRRAQ